MKIPQNKYQTPFRDETRLSESMFQNFCRKNGVILKSQDILFLWEKKLFFPVERIYLECFPKRKVFKEHNGRKRWIWVYPENLKKTQYEKLDSNIYYEHGAVYSNNKKGGPIKKGFKKARKSFPSQEKTPPTLGKMTHMENTDPTVFKDDNEIFFDKTQILLLKMIFHSYQSFSQVLDKTSQSKAYLIRGKFNHETRLPRCKMLFADKYLEVHPGDLWTDIKTTGLDNEGVVDFQNGKKPEKLINRIIGMSTNEGDLVLDSFLGSGTTTAVAQKMNRKWIGIELGDHAYTHCKVRLDKVINGDDQGGISKSVKWKGGGGYKFYELASSLLKKDKYGNFVIDTIYNAEMLASAMAKQESFKYAPDQDFYWKQGQSTENDYVYTTTQFVTVETLDRIHAEMQEQESLLICCKSFDSTCKQKYPNITLKKIPQMLLGRCEFGKEDYSLNIINVPGMEDQEIVDDFEDAA